MNRELMFGGPAATGAVMASVDPGWARRQEALGLSSDTSVPPAATSAAAASLAASKRDAVWEAKRQKRLAGQGGAAEPAFPIHSAIPVALEPPAHAPFAPHAGVALPQSHGLSRQSSPAPVPAVQFQPASLSAPSQAYRAVPLAEPAGRSPTEYSAPSVDAKAMVAAQKAAYSSALEAQMEAKRQQEAAHKQRAKEEAGMQYGFLANAVGEVEKNGGLAPRSFSPLRVRDPEPSVDPYDGGYLQPSAAAPVDPRAHKAAAAEEYARQLEYQMKQKQQLQAQQRQVEKLTAQQSAGIADIIGSSNSHQRTMAQVQQNLRFNPPPAPDALDVLRRENERQRPASAMDAHASRAEPYGGWNESARRGSIGASALARAGAFAVEAETRGEHEYRRVQSAKPDAHHAAMRAAAERNAHDASKPFHSPKDTYAEELRQQMAEKEARKRREKAISLAPAHIPTSRHAQRTEETNSRAVYLNSIGVDPARPSPPAYEQPSDFFSSSPVQPQRGSHPNQWNPSPITHDRPVLASMPSAAPYSQYTAPAPQSFMPQYAAPQPTIQPAYHPHAQPQYNAPPQPQYNAYAPPPLSQSTYPSYPQSAPQQQTFNNGYPGGPSPLQQQYGSSSPPQKHGGFGDSEQAKRAEEARRREQYAIELENQVCFHPVMCATHYGVFICYMCV
jgi:hypothetical protein